MISQQNRELLALIARNAALNAERAAEVTKENVPEANIEATYKMRDKFVALEDKLNNGEDLAFEDYANLWIGATVTRGILMNNINKWTAVVKEYDENLIPKLYAIAAETNEEKRKQMMEETFSAEN